jgi:putative membrane protein
MKTNRTGRPVAIVLAATVGALAAALSHGQASPASSAQVAPGVIRPGSTADEAGMTQRPTGIDAEFVDKAGMIGKVEQQASQLALDRSSNPAVKAFARRMVDDHGRIAGELRQLGAAKGVPVQSRMLVDPAVTALRTREGHAFDAAYVALAGPRAHEAAIRLYDAEARNGRDPQLRAFAANALPMLNAHLAAARRLEQTVAAAH